MKKNIKNTEKINIVDPKLPKEKKVKEPKEPFKIKFKRWFFGVGKEFSRTTWTSKKNLILDLLIVVLVAAAIILLFFGIDNLVNLI